MDQHNLRPSQFELFPKSQMPSSTEQDRPSLSFRLREITLAPENCVVSIIILIMSLVIFFSLGVEHGKKHLAAEIAPDGKKALQQENHVIMSPPESAIVSETVAVPVEKAAQSVQTPKQEVINLEELRKQQRLEEGVFTIQVASFKLESNAQKEADQLKRVGYETFVMAKGNYSIVCVGRFGEKQEAKETAVKLKKKYGDYLVRRL